MLSSVNFIDHANLTSTVLGYHSSKIHLSGTPTLQLVLVVADVTVVHMSLLVSLFSIM